MISRPIVPWPGDDGRIVVAVDVGEAVFGGQRAGVVLGFEKTRAVQHDVRAEPLAGVDLDQRREPRHDHRHRDVEQPPVVGEAERVVARGRGDDAALASAPASRSSRALRAPRSLKQPVRWRFSSLQKSRIPVTSESGIDSGQGET